MYYFRSLPDFSLIKYFFINLFSNSNNQINHLNSKDFSYLLFSYSRDAMNFLLKKNFIELNRKVNLCIPNLFCWEIISQFDQSFVNIIFYELDDELKIINIPNEKIDIFLYVDLFGIKSDISELRSICESRKIKLFIDQAHCSELNRKPNPNEFIFLSYYKHYPIPNGAALIFNKQNENEISQYFKNIKLFKHSNIKLITWILKSIFIVLSSRMKYLNNQYPKKNKIITRKESNFYYMSSISTIIINGEYEKLTNLNKTYSFYTSIVKMLSKKYEIKLINKDFFNSHLFTLKFQNNTDATIVYNIFKSLNLPVITWPEKKYISNIPSYIQKNSKDIIDKLIFLNSFYNSSISMMKKIKILNQIKKHIDEN